MNSSSTGIAFSGSTLTLHNAVLGTADIKVADKKSGYGLALAVGVQTATNTSGTTWALTEVKSGNKVTSNNVTYETLSNIPYYSLKDAYTVKYNKENVDAKLFTLTGLAADVQASRQSNGTFLVTDGEPSATPIKLLSIPAHFRLPTVLNSHSKIIPLLSTIRCNLAQMQRRLQPTATLGKRTAKLRQAPY